MFNVIMFWGRCREFIVDWLIFLRFSLWMFRRFCNWIENVPAITESPSKYPMGDVSHGDIFGTDVLNVRHQWLPPSNRCDFTWAVWILDIFRPMEGNQRHSWIVDSTPSITDPRYWIPAFVGGSWILNPIVSGILDSLGCIPDSKALDSRIYEQKLSGFRNPDSLTWSDILRSVPHCRTNYVSLRLRF